MYPVVRSTLGIVAGIFVFIVVIMVVERVNSEMHPMDLPPDFKKLDYGAQLEFMKDNMPEYMKTLPTVAFLIVLLGWELGALFGGATAAWIAGRWQLVHAGSIGFLVLMSTALNVGLLPHPTWMVWAGLLLPLPMSLLAGWLVKKIKEPRPKPKVQVKK